MSFVVCEQIRKEESGKFILLGVFTSNRIHNNAPIDLRWKQLYAFSFLVAISLNRQTDTGSYYVQLRILNKNEQTTIMHLDIKAEGNDYFCFPLSVLIAFTGPDTAILEIIRENDKTQSMEVGRFEFIDA